MNLSIGIKRSLFAIAIIFVFWFGFVDFLSESIQLLFAVVLAGLKLGDYAVEISRKVIPDELD